MKKQFSILNFKFTNIAAIWFGGLFVILIILFGFSKVNAQKAPEFMISWKALSFVPPEYEGKALYNGRSPVEISFELIDGNKFANISKNEIRWFVNNNLIDSGIGLKTIVYAPDMFTRNDIFLRVEIRNYRGQHINGEAVIPIADPEVVIDTQAREADFQALPYFFTATGLNQMSFEWIVNEERVSGEVKKPYLLTLDTSKLPVGTVVNIESIVKNIQERLEIASQAIQLLK